MKPRVWLALLSSYEEYSLFSNNCRDYCISVLQSLQKHGVKVSKEALEFLEGTKVGDALVGIGSAILALLAPPLAAIGASLAATSVLSSASSPEKGRVLKRQVEECDNIWACDGT